MSELPGGVAPARPAEPRDSALGVVWTRARGGRLEVLLGRRSRRSRFMPGFYAFPGGGLERQDRPGEKGALARCASRELREEVGIDIPESGWSDGGERITPPMFPVRFRARFFVAELSEPAALPAEPPSPENDTIELDAPAAYVERWARGEIRIAPPVLAVLRALSEAGAAGDLARVVRRANAEEEHAPRIEFVPGVRVVPVRSRTLPPATHTNVWIPCGDRFVVIDPGSDEPDELEQVLGATRRLEREGRSAAGVVLTHGHADHVAGARATAEALRVPVRAHPLAVERAGRHLDGVDCEPLEDGDRVDLGGATLEAVRTDGHARGHLVFLLRPHGALVSGDLVSALSTMSLLPGEGDVDAYLASLEKASRLGPEVLLPGHGPPVPPVALENVRRHRIERDARILEAVRHGCSSLEAIAASAYADTPDAPARLAELQTKTHLVRLERSGRVVLDGAAGYRATGEGAT